MFTKTLQKMLKEGLNQTNYELGRPLCKEKNKKKNSINEN